jgi:hypothetical protein
LQAEEQFKLDFIDDVASALQADSSLFAVKSMEPGSIVVGLQIGGDDANALKLQLESQISDKSSALYNGKVTKHAMAEGDDDSAPAVAPAVASAVAPVVAPSVREEAGDDIGGDDIGGDDIGGDDIGGDDTTFGALDSTIGGITMMGGMADEGTLTDAQTDSNGSSSFGSTFVSNLTVEDTAQVFTPPIKERRRQREAQPKNGDGASHATALSAAPPQPPQQQQESGAERKDEGLLRSESKQGGESKFAPTEKKASATSGRKKATSGPRAGTGGGSGYGSSGKADADGNLAGVFQIHVDADVGEMDFEEVGADELEGRSWSTDEDEDDDDDDGGVWGSSLLKHVTDPRQQDFLQRLRLGLGTAPPDDGGESNSANQEAASLNAGDHIAPVQTTRGETMQRAAETERATAEGMHATPEAMQQAISAMHNRREEELAKELARAQGGAASLPLPMNMQVALSTRIISFPMLGGWLQQKKRSGIGRGLKGGWKTRYFVLYGGGAGRPGCELRVYADMIDSNASGGGVTRTGAAVGTGAISSPAGATSAVTTGDTAAIGGGGAGAGGGGGGGTARRAEDRHRGCRESQERAQRKHEGR